MLVFSLRGPVHIIYILKGLEITLLLGNTIHTSLGGTDQHHINITLQTIQFEWITVSSIQFVPDQNPDPW